MVVKTSGELQSILKNYGAKDWLKKAETGVEFKGPTQPNSLQDSSSGKTFGDFLADSLNKVNDLQVQANKAMEELATGKSKNLHETMLRVEEAEVAFKMMNQVRQKVLDAYKEIMRMQV